MPALEAPTHAEARCLVPRLAMLGAMHWERNREKNMKGPQRPQMAMLDTVGICWNCMCLFICIYLLRLACQGVVGVERLL